MALGGKNLIREKEPAMKIPKYWGKGTAQGMDRKGKTMSFSCWHWSELSEDDAREKAQAKAALVLSKYISEEKLNAYSYGERPMREEIVQVVSDRDNHELALVTRNSYGALVLNASKAMFMDIDLAPESLTQRLAGFLGGLLGREKKPGPEALALEEIHRFRHKHPDLDLRVYRTFAGLRCLCTNLTFDPAQPSTMEMMKELNCDPLYVKLCRQQECFRARLTPKFWRCDLPAPPARYPFESAAAEKKFREWEQNYNQVSTEYAVCKMVTKIGQAPIHPEIQPILSLHDKFCLSGETLALA